jgi:hypothetical protein
MLAQTSLLTLHIDIRCGILHQLARTLRGPGPAEVDAAGNGSTISPSEKNLNNNRDSSGLPPLDSGLYPYVLPSPPASASPLILELNTDLIAFDANIATYLGTRERNFILHGLARLVDRYLVVAADVIGVMNKNGAERVRIDAMVMQQNLRAILASTTSSSPAKDSSTSITTGQSTNPTTDAATGLGISTVSSTPQQPEDDDDSGLLTSSSRYFNLSLQGPESILQHVRDCKAQKKDVGYSYDELRTLVELCYSADLRGEDREKSIKARKAQQEVLLALGEVMWDS